MSLRSAIEWTDATWNPVTGCTKISPGCKFCYAERLTERFGRQVFTEVTLHPERVSLPLHWRAPRRVFVNSMSDLFHEKVPSPFIRDVFEVMSKASQHVFQVLTKRPDRLLEWRRSGAWPKDFPEHIWMGVSVESSAFLWRIDRLREVDAAVRFISAEPPPRAAQRTYSRRHPLGHHRRRVGRARRAIARRDDEGGGRPETRACGVGPGDTRLMRGRGCSVLS